MPYQSYFLQRYAEFHELVGMVRDLKSAYDQTGNETVLRVLRKLEGAVEQFMDDEIEWNTRDFDEILENPHLYPHAVVTWAHSERRERGLS